MQTMNAEEKDALKKRAVTMLRAALKGGMDPKVLLRKCDMEAEALGRYLGGESFPPPNRAQAIIDALK